jgi:hypothetical protein
MAFRLARLGPKLRDYHRAWYAALHDKGSTPDDLNTLAALGNIIDYYGADTDVAEMEAKNNYEINWDEWKHLMTPGIVDNLKAKLDAIAQEEYETEPLAESAVDETEDLRKMRHFLTWNGELHKDFYDEKASLLENISHAQPFETINHWELQSMYKYEDCPSRWDQEMGWYMPNNDQVTEDVWTANMF